MNNQEHSRQTERANAGSHHPVIKPPHPWKQAMDAQYKLKAARHEAEKRRSLEYRHDHLEERQLMERHWHRKKLNLPLEAPKIKPWDHVKGRVDRP